MHIDSHPEFLLNNFEKLFYLYGSFLNFVKLPSIESDGYGESSCAYSLEVWN